MNREQLRRIAIALGALLVVWLGLRIVRGTARDRGDSLDMAPIDRSAVDAITISRPEDSIRLVRQGTAWTVNGYDAAATSVDDLLGSLTDTARASELVAESATSHARLGVDSASARRLEISAGGKVVLAYLIGKRGASWESGYVRRPNDDEVYQVKGRLVDIVDRSVDDWRDRTILAVEPDSVATIRIERGKRGFDLVRADSGWRFADGTAVDSSGIATLLDKLKKLEGAGFASQSQIDSTNFTTPERRVRIALRGGRTLGMLQFDSTGGGFWVRRDSLPTVFRLDSWTADQITPSDSSLKKR